MATQLITPNPNIWCRPGWCLEYVNNAFSTPTSDGSDRVPAIRASATDAWYGSSTQHRDRNFPSGVWIPVWYGIVQEPLGHVVLRAPDGTVYSTSDLSNVPHHHPDLVDLERYYAKYGLDLTYRGWTEDVEGTPVIDLDGIDYSSTNTAEENPLANFTADEVRQLVIEGINNWSMSVRQFEGNRNMLDTFKQHQAEHGAILNAVNGIPNQILFANRVDGRNIVDTGRQGLANDAKIMAAISGIESGSSITAADIAAAIPTDIAQQVADLLAKRLAE